ncbi:MAG: tagaturonate reductase [bacterium]
MTSTAVMPKLDRSLLHTIREGHGSAVVVPEDSLLDLPELAVQFGTGALLRGFLDDFLHRANLAGKFGGRVVMIGSTGSARDRSIREQDGLYTLVVEGIERGERVQECRIIGSVSRACSASDDWEQVLELARAPQLQYVFSNTTEVGIVADDVSGVHDAPPKSFPAKLTRFLWERAATFQFGAESALVVIPCELIENNGARLKEIVLAIATRWNLGADFSRWVNAHITFCNTLVDRIVPGAPRDGQRERIAGMLGYEDALVTCCEPYRLFAIEGDTALRKKLTWAEVDDAIIVAPDISPYRTRKVRLLNGAHSLLVSASLLMGFEIVRDAVNDSRIARLVRAAMFDEIAPTLGVEGADEFAEAVLDRFRNPFIDHALIDITLQATMKMRVRIVPSVQQYMAVHGTVPQSLAFGFATFLLFMQGRIQDERRAQGLSVPSDEQGERLRSLWAAVPAGAPVREFVLEVCRDNALWGTDLTSLPGFCDAVVDHLQRARAHGVAAALEHHLRSS